MTNKTDQFDGFDPTQNQGQGCCGELYWDFDTQTWKQRPIPEPVAEGDCSQVQAKLNQANATIADLQNKLNIAQQKVAELQAELDAQPTVCEILAQHLYPVKRLNGEVIWYGLKNAEGCPDLVIKQDQSLGGVGITNAVAP